MLKPRSERKLSADEIIQELRPKLATVPGIRVFLQNPPAHSDRRAADQEPVPVHPAGRGHRGALPGIAGGPGEDRRAARLAGRHQRPSDHEPAGQRGDRPGQGLGPRHHRKPDRERPVQRLWLPAGLDDLHADQPVPGHPGAGARVPAGPGRPLPALRPLQQGPAGSAERRGQLRPGIGPLTVNHLGQLPSVTISFNLKPGASLGEAVTQVERIGRTTLPATISASFQGTAQAFQSSLKGMGLLLAPGDPGHLHRPGDSLRELHPSDHHSVGSSLGGRRRPAHACCSSATT